jgi:hypothetical protein
VGSRDFVENLLDRQSRQLLAIELRDWNHAILTSAQLHQCS